MADISYGQIYLSINLINGKRYIGQSKQNNPHYYGSGSIIKMAIKKYGRKNFEKKILWEGYTSSKSLNRLEIIFISKHKTTIKNGGYNIVKGGLGYSHKMKDVKMSEEVKKKSLKVEWE